MSSKTSLTFIERPYINISNLMLSSFALHYTVVVQDRFQVISNIWNFHALLLSGVSQIAVVILRYNNFGHVSIAITIETTMKKI